MYGLQTLRGYSIDSKSCRFAWSTIKNKFAESVLDGTVAPPTVCDNCLKHCSHKFCIIRALSRTVQQGDVETGLVFSGNNMRKVDRIMPVKDIFAQLKQQVAEID